MQSEVAAALAQQQRARLLAMSPTERVALALRMSEEGVASFMATHGVDRATACARIKATRRAGRRRSPCAEADDH